jgi:methyl-accepting chemotaxis protein
MIEKIQLFFKDPAKVNQLAIVGFFVAVFLTAFYLFRLPNDLVYQGGMINSGRATVVYTKLYVVIALAFAMCYAVVHYTRKSKKEIIVYLDKKQEEKNQQSADGDNNNTTSGLDLKSLREKITKAKAREEKWQEALNHLCDSLNAGQGALYITKTKGGEKLIELQSSYALVLAEGEKNPSFLWGEGLIGQAATSGQSLYLDELPEGYARRIESGLGNALPKFLYIMPLKKENDVVGVVELATFTPLNDVIKKQANEAGIVIAEIS